MVTLTVEQIEDIVSGIPDAAALPPSPAEFKKAYDGAVGHVVKRLRVFTKESRLPTTSQFPITNTDNKNTVLQTILWLSLTDIYYLYAIFQNQTLRAQFLALDTSLLKGRWLVLDKLFAKIYGVSISALQQILPDEQKSRQFLLKLLQDDKVSSRSRQQLCMLLLNKPLAPQQATEPVKPQQKQQSAAQKSLPAKQDDPFEVFFTAPTQILSRFGKSDVTPTQRVALGKLHPVFASWVLNSNDVLGENTKVSDAIALIKDFPTKKSVVDDAFKLFRLNQWKPDWWNKWRKNKTYTPTAAELCQAAQASPHVRDRILVDRELCFTLLQNDPEKLSQLYDTQQSVREYGDFMTKVVNKTLEKGFFDKLFNRPPEAFSRLSPNQLAFLAIHHPAVVQENILSSARQSVNLFNADTSLIIRLYLSQRNFLEKAVAIAAREVFLNIIFRRSGGNANDKAITAPEIVARLMANNLQILQNTKLRADVLNDADLPREILKNTALCFAILNDLSLLQELNAHHKEFLVEAVVVCRSNPDKFNVQLEARVMAVVERDKILKDIPACIKVLNDPKLVEELNTHHKEFLDKVVTAAVSNLKGQFPEKVTLHNSLPIRVRTTAVTGRKLYLEKADIPKCCGVLNDFELLQELHQNYREFTDKLVQKVFAQPGDVKFPSNSLAFLMTHYPQARQWALKNESYVREIGLNSWLPMLKREQRLSKDDSKSYDGKLELQRFFANYVQPGPKRSKRRTQAESKMQPQGAKKALSTVFEDPSKKSREVVRSYPRLSMG